MPSYKYENGNYYRQASDKTWFPVKRNKDGWLTWTQPNGTKIVENSFKVPLSMDIRRTKTGTGIYTVPIGANGSLGSYTSFQDAAKAYTEAIDSGAFSDPSENILNDLIFDALTGKGLVSLANKGTKVAGRTARQFTKAPKLVLGKKQAQLARQAANRPIKNDLGFYSMLSIPTGIAGIGADVLSYSSTGKTMGQTISEDLTGHYGFRVPQVPSLLPKSMLDRFREGYQTAFKDKK